MKTQYHDYRCYNYCIDAASKVATEYYPLEKGAKISYRILDLIKIFHNNIPLPFVTLSSQLKDLILGIEASRFFCVSFPVFFPKNGISFFQNKPFVKYAEKISIISHLALKTLFGAERVNLIRLGIIGTYTLGNLSIFKWAIESTVLLYNFFGSWDGASTWKKAESNMVIARHKVEKWNLRKKTQNICPTNPAADIPSKDRIAGKQRKWEIIIENLQIERNTALLKIAATASKFVLIILATTFAVINIWTIPCQVSVLGLGVISDAIGMGGYFYQQYKLPRIV